MERWNSKYFTIKQISACQFAIPPSPFLIVWYVHTSCGYDYHQLPRVYFHHVKLLRQTKSDSTWWDSELARDDSCHCFILIILVLNWQISAKLSLPTTNLLSTRPRPRPCSYSSLTSLAFNWLNGTGEVYPRGRVVAYLQLDLIHKPCSYWYYTKHVLLS